MNSTEINPSRLSLGTKVSIITGAQYRYEGTVAAINSIEGTLTLQNVCFWGIEDRTAEPSATQNTEKKLPAVGSIFNLITFWMSSIVQIWLPNDENRGKNEIGDKGIAKAGIPVDMNRSRGRRPRTWWQPGDPQRPVPNGTSPTEGIDNMTGRYTDSVTPPIMHNPPRMLVSYPRRGRTVPRHGGYVPVLPVVQESGGMRRSAYGANVRSPSYRMMATPVPPGSRMGGRRSGPAMRHMMGSSDDHRYKQAMLNSAGGVLVYLPPDLAAAYQSHGLNFVSTRPVGRRRVADRRGAVRGSENTDPEIDCTTPYDFEAANAELEAELAKITISPDGVPMPIASQSGSEALGTGNSPTSTGDRQTTTLRSPSAISAAGNGASGDSTLGAAVAAGNVGAASSQSGGATSEGSGPLAKGEYYVREKCFFDQISRPESGPRNSFAGDGTRYGGSRPGASNRRFAYGHGSSHGGGFSSHAAARRERQLNLETFGSLAARTTFMPRRRAPPPGHMHRDYLVSAPA